MKQISQGKQRETKNGTPEIEVVTNAMLKPPMHPRKQVKGFGDMGKNDQHQTSRADELEERAHRLSFQEQGFPIVSPPYTFFLLNDDMELYRYR